MRYIVQSFAEAVAQMFVAKADRGFAPKDQLFEFVGLLREVDWSGEVRSTPPRGTIAALRHLPEALVGAYAGGPCPIVDALRLCVGLTPWETFYADSDWSRPFLGEFASGELVGPRGFVRSTDISLGLFLLGPDTTYTEHAHGSTEIYYPLSGEARWRIGDPDNVVRAEPGALVFTEPHQRHDIRTGAAPLLAVFAWKANPAAPSYYRAGGPWRGGPVVRPDLVNRA